jgi:hypothetical protein
MTTEKPLFEREAYQPDRYGDRWAPVLIAWVSGDNDLRLKMPKLGLGLPIPVKNDAEQLIYVTGLIGLNAGYQAPSGFAKTTDLGSVIMHELGHLVGLGHVGSHSEVMHPTANQKSATVWGPGDTLGLLLLGKASGCLEEPAPRTTTGDWDSVDFPEMPRP